MTKREQRRVPLRIGSSAMSAEALDTIIILVERAIVAVRRDPAASARLLDALAEALAPRLVAGLVAPLTAALAPRVSAQSDRALPGGHARDPSAEQPSDARPVERSRIIPEHLSLEEACVELGLNYKTVVCWPSSRRPGTLAKWAALRAWKNPAGRWRVPTSTVRDIRARATTGLGMARKRSRA